VLSQILIGKFNHKKGDPMKVNYFDPKLWGKGLGVGSARCPMCKKIYPVMNEHGLDGKRDLDYIQIHNISTNIECRGSEKFIKDLK
jgi:hypothetical protein